MSENILQFQGCSLQLTSESWLIVWDEPTRIRSISLEPQELAENAINRDLREFRQKDTMNLEALFDSRYDEKVG